MSTTPSNPDYINTRALEDFVLAFDRVLMGRYDLLAAPQRPHPELQQESQGIIVLFSAEDRRWLKKNYGLTFWRTFPPLKFLRRIRDDFRLRKYNREWIKNNIH